MNTHVRLLHGPIRNLMFGSSRVRGARVAWAPARRLAVVLAVVVCGVLALGAGSAFALITFPFDGQIAPAGGSFGTLEAGSVAVNDSNGDTYVADSSSGTVDVFETASGSQLAGLDGSLTPAGSFGGRQVEVAANNGTGDVYVLDSTDNVVDVFSSAGGYVCQITGGSTPSASECNGVAGSDTPAHGFSTPGGIAVDQATGEVYVVDAHNGAVDVFSAAGAYLPASSISLASIEGGFNASFTRGIAVDDFNGDVYVSDSGSPNPASEDVVYVFNAAGEYETTWTGIPGLAFGGGYVSVAADNASGDVFVTSTIHGATDVFEASGGYITQFSHSFHEPRGAAVDQATHRVYVSDNSPSVVDVFGPGPVLVPDVVTGSASGVHPASATLEGSVNPDGVQVTACHFEYGTSTSYGQSVACAQEPGSGTAEVPVSAEATGLQANTVYHYRLTAANANGASSGEDATFTTPGPPTVDTESSASVTQKSAYIQAQINPNGLDTTYRFQYGPTTAYGTSVPVPDGDIGSGKADVARSALIEGLSPGTAYHYRVVASNSAGTVQGADRVFLTQAGEAAGLPDGRAWEMVSPLDKLGAALDGIGANGGIEIQAAADGSAITYESQGPIGAEPASNRSIARTSILSSRTAGGWTTRQIATPHEAVAGGVGDLSEYRIFSSDLSVGLVEPDGDTLLSPQATEKTPYLREANGEYTPLVTAANVPAGVKFGVVQSMQQGIPAGKEAGVKFSGASFDVSHVVLQSPLPLTEGVAPQGGLNENSFNNLFEWSGGSLRLVSVLPNNKAATEEELGASLGDIEGVETNVRHAISDDGSRIFWATSSTTRERSLYMRDMRAGESVQLDAAEPEASGESGGGIFATASSDGSKVFFTDRSRLTPDSTADVIRADLYMCEIVEVAGKLACRLKDLTVDHNAGESAGVQGEVIGAGEDGRYVYFVANGVLAAGATPGDCTAEGGQMCNLYVYDTVSGETRFIAWLPGSDDLDWRGNLATLAEITAGVSPDGRYLTFMSDRSLTGYDNIDAHSGQPDVEVYLYDASTRDLTCPSCNPSGARPSGVFDAGGFPGSLVDRQGSWAGRWLAGSIPGWTNTTRDGAYYRSRYLSDSGRLFFDSADALVPRDTNGTEDVYEYEPNGVGGCAKAGGCVGLISSGTSSAESAFLDASESGNDVFFLTASRLVSQDLDSALDVYDARVCSASSPCLAGTSAQSSPCATADACRAAPSSQPGVFGAPPSATFSGAGNPVQGASKLAARKRVLTVAQKRAAALRKCRAKHRRRRASCEAQVRRRYRVGVKAKRSLRSPIRKGNR